MCWMGFLLLPFLPHQISPNLGFLGGNLTNIVRDSSGFITSATVEDLSMRWELTGTPGGGCGVRLFTKVGLPFSGDVDGLPVSPGTVIAGADPFEGFLDLGGGASLLARDRAESHAYRRARTWHVDPLLPCGQRLGGCWRVATLTISVLRARVAKSSRHSRQSGPARTRPLAWGKWHLRSRTFDARVA